MKPLLAGVVFAVVCAATGVDGSAQRGQRGQQAAAIEAYVTQIKALLAAFAGGDETAAAEAVRTTASGQPGRGMGPASGRPLTLVLGGTRLMGSAEYLALEQVLLDPAERWSRAKAAFPLAMAVAALKPLPDRRSITTLVRLGSKVLVLRPTPLGADPVEDRFEILWHQTALGLLQGLQNDYTMAEPYQREYLTSIEPRFTQAALAGKTFDSRVPLASALVVESRCCADLWDTRRVRPPDPLPTLAETLQHFERAAAQPSARAEALVRGAHLQFKVGRPDGALQWLERVPDTSADRLLHFAHHLLRGRVQDALGHTEDAVRAYTIAREFGPASQFPGIGLAAALMRAGRAEEGTLVAAEVRKLPVGPDPWVEFQRADARFVTTWLAEIRKLMRTEAPAAGRASAARRAPPRGGGAPRN